MSATRIVLSIVFCAIFIPLAHGAPNLFITPSGIVGNDRLWTISISADPSLFVDSGPNGSPPNTPVGQIAVELGFSIDPGNLLNLTQDSDTFPHSNPGASPFPDPIGGIQVGLVSSGNNIFASLGSVLFTNSNPVPLTTFTTAGSGLTKVNWLGTHSGKGRIAENGFNFDTFSGSITVPEPTTTTLVGTGLMTAALFCLRRNMT